MAVELACQAKADGITMERRNVNAPVFDDMIEARRIGAQCRVAWVIWFHLRDYRIGDESVAYPVGCNSGIHVPGN